MGYYNLLSFAVVIILTFFPVHGVNASEKDKLVCDIWPPYQIMSIDGVHGYSVSVVEAVYDRLNKPHPSVDSFPWKRAMDMVMHDRAIGIFSANHTPERAMYMHYPSEPLIVSPWVIWTRGGRVESLDDLRGKTIGVVLGYSYTDEFWDFIEKYCNVEAVHSDEVNFVKLDAGRLDAVIAEYGNGYYLVTSKGMKNIVPNMGVVVKEDGLYVAFNRELVSQSFVDDFSRELVEFKKTDQYRSLLRKYFGEQ